MTETGQELRENNEQIVKLMLILKRQRDEMHYLIQKQEQEKQKIQTDIEKLSFKLTLLTKSLSQRLQARNNYDKTIKEIESSYKDLVLESGKLLGNINKEVEVLEQIMDKKIGTQKSTDGSLRTPSVRSGVSKQSQEGEMAEEPEILQELQEHRDSRQSQKSQLSQQSQRSSLKSGLASVEDVKPVRHSDDSQTGSGRLKIDAIPIKPEELQIHRSESEKIELEKLEMGEEEDETSSTSLHKSESDVKRASSGSIIRSQTEVKRTSSGSLKSSKSDVAKTSSQCLPKCGSAPKAASSGSLKRSGSDVRKTSSGSIKLSESAAKNPSTSSLKMSESDAKTASSSTSLKKAESDSKKSASSLKKPGAQKSSSSSAKRVDVKSISHSSVYDDTNASATKNNWRSISDTEKGDRDSESEESDTDSARPCKSKSQASHCSVASCGGKKRGSSGTSRSIKDDKVDDVEVQSFREAYGRQHTASPPVRRNK